MSKKIAFFFFLKKKSKISFLQGERRGQENLKNDLIRRIKMLELALKQERVKYYKLKTGCDPKTQEDLLKPQCDTSSTQQQQQQQDLIESEINYANILSQNADSVVADKIKNGRQLLKQYLQEIGNTDSIIDIRSTRLRTLLNNSSLQQQQQQPLKKQPLTTAELTVKKLLGVDQLNSNNNNNNSGHGVIDIVDMDISENAEDVLIEEGDLLNVTAINRVLKLQNGSSATQQQMGYEDLETEDALKEFSFLSNENSTTTTTSAAEIMNDDWNMNKETLNKLTEQYKKERKIKVVNKNQQQQQNNDANLFQRPNRSILQAMIANLNDNASQYDDKSSVEKNENQQQQQQAAYLEDDTSLNLGELSRISVNNIDDTIIIDTSSINSGKEQDETTTAKRTLTIKSSLRGHFDAIRCLNFHPNEAILLTGSEDQTVKLWCLDKSVNNLSSSLNHPLVAGASKKSLSNANNSDIDPLYTFRGHTGAVLNVVISQNGQHFFTSSTDCTIKLWNLPNDDIDPYDAFGKLEKF